MFVIYVLFLIVSGIAMLVMASANSGQTPGRRVWYAVLGAGFTLYGLYLLLYFRGGHYLLFFYVVILPVLMTVRFFRDRSTFRTKQQAAAVQGTPPGYAQPPGGGGIQGAAAIAAETAGLVPGAAHTPTGSDDAGSGPQLTVGDIAALGPQIAANREHSLRATDGDKRDSTPVTAVTTVNAAGAAATLQRIADLITFRSSTATPEN